MPQRLNTHSESESVSAPTGNCIMDYAETTVLKDMRVLSGGTDVSLEPSATHMEKSTFRRVFLNFNNAKIEYQTESNYFFTENVASAESIDRLNARLNIFPRKKIPVTR